MVSTYPPKHCGIGAYAEQSTARLRSEGHVVDILSPDRQGNVDFAWDLCGGFKLLQLLQLLPYYDKVVIQYHWAFYHSSLEGQGSRWENVKTVLAFIILFLRSRRIEVVAHELPLITSRLRWLYGLQWKMVPKLVLHTPQERQRFEQHYHIRFRDSRVQFRKHDQVYRPYVNLSRLAARQKLGIDTTGTVFLCIGFIQLHKGFHRAIEAFQRAAVDDARLFVVGSLRVTDEENFDYLEKLFDLAKPNRDIHVIQSYVSNEDFDTWISASDWVVVPYSEIWSSAVLGRAKLLQRPAIVSNVGGLPGQASPSDILFATDNELTLALRTASAKLGTHPSGL
jgi:glycosyltransferase involved in cell wall biosynthesis